MKIKTLKNDYKITLKLDKENTKACGIMISSVILSSALLLGADFNNELISPIPKDGEIEVTREATPSAKPRVRVTGSASWYGTGEGECIGCDKNRIMANGEKLDDSKKTIACSMDKKKNEKVIPGTCRKFSVGTEVEIRNMSNNMITEARVTDTGGFGLYKDTIDGEKVSRVIDISKATRNAISCGDICKVRVYKKGGESK